MNEQALQALANTLGITVEQVKTLLETKEGETPDTTVLDKIVVFYYSSLCSWYSVCNTILKTPAVYSPINA